jgi:hypothetical protein
LSENKEDLEVKKLQYMLITVCILGLAFLLPAHVLADGVHPVEKAELTRGTYVFLFFAVLAMGFAVLAILRKSKDAKPGMLRWGWMLALAGLVLTGAANATGVLERKSEITVDHIHGIGYSADGKRLLVAAHDGLRVYNEGMWSRGAGDKNDYMGFSMTDSGFYGSGHPEPGSKLKDPLGLIHSQDEGASLHMLDFYGEIDFHAVAAGYRSHALYVYNPQPHVKLAEAGLYASADAGKTWTRSKLSGITGELGAIAAHPDKPEAMAAGTTGGLYVSQDSGQTVEAVMTGRQVTSVAYGPDGALYAGTYSGGKAGLIQVPAAGSKPVEIPAFPVLEKDAIAYFSVNPQNPGEWAAASFNMQIYISEDSGRSWSQVMEKGKGK